MGDREADFLNTLIRERFADAPPRARGAVIIVTKI